MIFDERKMVIEICKQYGIIPVFSKLTEENLINYLNRFIENFGFYHEEDILEQAANLKVNLIMSGFGGDEFVSKADSGIMSDLLFRFNWGTFIRKYPFNKPKDLIKTLFYNIIFPAVGQLSPPARKMFKELAYYIKKPYKRYDKKHIKDLYFYKSRRDIHLNIIKSYYNPHRTEIWTINGFRKGILYRFPLLDKRIVEYMLKVPSILLCNTNYSRSLIREISNNILPDTVIWKKSGTDPLLFSHCDFLVKSVFTKLINDISSWEQNQNLNFIDFNLLKKDIQEFNAYPFSFSKKNLFSTVLLIKGLHEFCRAYYS